MTQNITITAEEVREGDRISVTRPLIPSDDRTVTTTYTGVAHCADRLFNSKPVWRTAAGGNLYVHEEGAVIELLDRPEPKIVLPTGVGATIVYTKTNDGWQKGRVAVFNGTNWNSHYPNGEWRDGRSSKRLTEWFEDGIATDLKVLSEGVAK